MDPAQIPVDDRGFLLGDGLFETVLFKDGEPVLWDAHVARLIRGCAAIGLPQPDPALLDLEARRSIVEGNFGEARAAVRLTWTAGSGGRGIGRPEPMDPRLVVTAALSERPEAAASVIVSNIRRNDRSPTARLKSLNYLDNVLARREAVGEGADEALMLSTTGLAACATAANLFWIAGGRLYTPSLDCGVLGGIVRAQVIEASAAQEVRADLQTVLQAEAAFLTSSLIGIRRIGVLAGRALGPHPMIEQLNASLAALF